MYYTVIEHSKIEVTIIVSLLLLVESKHFRERKKTRQKPVDPNTTKKLL